MLSVANAAQPGARIDRSPTAQANGGRSPGGHPAVAAEWADWDEADRLAFVLERPLREDRLRQIDRWSAEVRLTAAQRRRDEDLQAVVHRHRATLARLLAH